MKLYQTIKEKMGARTLKSGFWLYCAQIFNLICPMISLPYITRVLGPNQYGFFSISLNIITYLQVAVEYGFLMSATRELANNDKGDINKLYSTVFFARIFLLVVSLMVLGVYIILISDNTLQIYCSLILIVGLLDSCLQVNWLFHGKQEMMSPAIVTMICRVVSLISIFCLVKTPNDILLYCFLYAIFPLCGTIACRIIAKYKYKLKIVKVTMREVCGELKTGWYTFTTQMSSKIFSGIGLTFLGVFATPYEAGIYSALQKIPYVITLVWGPIGQAIYPMISQKYHESFDFGVTFVMKVMRYILSFFLFIILLIALLAQPITRLCFGTEYAPYFYWLYPQLIWVFLSIANNFVGVQILLASGHDKEYAQCFYIGIIVNVLINLTLIVLCKGFGASLAPMCSEFLLMLLMLYKIIKIKRGQSK